MDYYGVTFSKDLKHHGILGQMWGRRHGPPYPLDSDVSTGNRLKNDYAVNKSPSSKDLNKFMKKSLASNRIEKRMEERQSDYLNARFSGIRSLAKFIQDGYSNEYYPFKSIMQDRAEYIMRYRSNSISNNDRKILSGGEEGKLSDTAAYLLLMDQKVQYLTSTYFMQHGDKDSSNPELKKAGDLTRKALNMYTKNAEYANSVVKEMTDNVKSKYGVENVVIDGHKMSVEEYVKDYIKNNKRTKDFANMYLK